MSGADFYYCPDVHGEYITPLSIFPERSEYFYENFVLRHKKLRRGIFRKTSSLFPGITIKFTEANIHEETASLAKGYEAICAFVNADLGTEIIEELHNQGVKLILMRCAGYNNVDLETAHKYGIKVLRVPGYSPEAVAEHAMALALDSQPSHSQGIYQMPRE